MNRYWVASIVVALSVAASAQTQIDATTNVKGLATVAKTGVYSDLATKPAITDDGTTLTYSGTGGVSAPKVSTTGSGAGAVVLGQGTAQVSTANAITTQAPTTVTAYIVTLPAAAPANNNSIRTISTAGVESFIRAPQIAYQAADTTASATATLATTGITFALDASTVYTLDCMIYMQVSTTATNGFRLGVAGPGTPTYLSLSMDSWTSQTAKRSEWYAGTAWSQNIGSTAVTYSTNPLPVRLTGTIENGTTAGTLTIQYANVSATGTTTVKRGSWCRLQ